MSSSASHPNANNPGPRGGSEDRAWILIGVIAGVFALLVSGALLIGYLRARSADPLKSTQLSALKEQLRKSPGDQKLKDSIRAKDLEVRRRFFANLALNKGGAWLLLGAGVVLAFATKRALKIHETPPQPRLNPDPVAESNRLAASARWSAGATMAATGLVFVALGITARTNLPDKPADLARLSGAGEQQGSETVVDAATPEQMRANWPRFLGPDGNPMSPETDYPVSWSYTNGVGVLWKSPVPAPGHSSPVVWENRVLLSGGDATNRFALCFDADSGSLLWQREIANVPGSPSPVPEIPEGTGYAASTGATDGRRFYVLFGNGDLAALSLDGSVLWTKAFGALKNGYGHASSLATWQGRVVVQLDQGEGSAGKSQIYALEGTTGRLLWQRSRPVPSTWASPIVVEAAGKAQVVAMGVPWLIAYSAIDGNELWRADALAGEITPSPVFAGGLLLATSPSDKLSAFRMDGQGDVTKTHIAWSAEDDIPDIATPVANNELVFALNGSGMLTCFQIADGKKLWSKDFAMECAASPALGGNRIYLFGRKGLCVVGEVGREFKELSRDDLGEEVFASPALVRKRIFVRTVQTLICLGTREAQATASRP